MANELYGGEFVLGALKLLAVDQMLRERDKIIRLKLIVPKYIGRYLKLA
ncbi:MAG: hypothetical protein MI755_08355 [Sphingomonadales bacterium]|nr:hypothetical protein [Sphingomonadales bacterium]